MKFQIPIFNVFFENCKLKIGNFIYLLFFNYELPITHYALRIYISSRLMLDRPAAAGLA